MQSHYHQGAHYSCLLKLQLLKQPIKIHRCVVIWLHILVGPCWCVYVALFGSTLYFRTVQRTRNKNTSVYGDVAAYISGSLLVCVRCTLRKQSLLPNSVKYTYQQVPTNIRSQITTHRCILIDYFNNCNFNKHE